MIKTLDELLNEIKKGTLVEHRFPNVELKRSWGKECGHKVSALGNKVDVEASWMVIGMEDDGRLSSSSEKWAIQTEQTVSQNLNAELDPAQACLGTNALQINGGWVVVVKINNPGAVVLWNAKAYKASGTTIAEMRPEEIMEFTIKLPGVTDFSKQEGSSKVNKGLSSTFIERLLNVRHDLPFKCEEDYDIDNIFGFIKIRKTKTADILFGDYQYRVIYYDKNEAVSNQETRRGLYGLLDEKLIGEIQSWSKTLNNTTENTFPEIALKEGLANAVAHAAYFESNGEIIIEIFADKIIISNLCLPECGYFANKWFSRSHKTVNGLLMETLRLARIVDELGRGKNLIFSDSIKNGKKSPMVTLEKAGRFNRWRLYIYGGIPNKTQLRLRDRINDVYTDESKALIAYALVLWRRYPVTQIRKFIDDESAPLFAEVLNDAYGPIFFYKKEDRLIPQRWVRILLEEGKDSKIFTLAEEERLYNLAYDIHVKHYKSIITPKELRRLGDMGDTKSAGSLSSNMLQKWAKEKKVLRIKKGKYKFIQKYEEESSFSKLMEFFKEKKI